MRVLAIDVGSSSVKMGVMRGGRLIGHSVRESFPTTYAADRAEIDPDHILAAIARAAKQIGNEVKRADIISMASMSPSWLAMDKRGRPLTPIISHQDRRSLQIAIQIEKRVGKRRHLELCGSRPVPGGISSTTCGWFLQNERSLMRKADLIGHLPTFLLRQFCGVRVVDPSHASFMGLFSTVTLGGWNQTLCHAIGISQKLLPEIKFANQIVGGLLPAAARRLGALAGIPVLAGMIDTGAAILLAGARVGQMVNVVGTTDVLALCTDRPRPHERLLTRALGVGRRWVSAATIGAAGSCLTWANEQFFADLSDKQFFKLVEELANAGAEASRTVRFEPYLAGDRVSVEQRRGAFEGLSLSTTREQMLAAIIDALAQASVQRLDLLTWTGTPMRRQVMISGGGNGALAKIMHRDWPGKWTFRLENEATMRGLEALAKLAESA